MKNKPFPLDQWFDVGLQKHGNINMVLDVVALIAFVAVFMILILI